MHRGCHSKAPTPPCLPHLVGVPPSLPISFHTRRPPAHPPTRLHASPPLTPQEYIQQAYVRDSYPYGLFYGGGGLLLASQVGG